MSKACQINRQLIVLFGTVALMITGFSSVATADTEVDASHVVVVSDDIMKRTTDLGRAGDDGNGSGNDDNKSGLGDGTNPGQGGGKDNASNTGTDNPNNSQK